MNPRRTAAAAGCLVVALGAAAGAAAAGAATGERAPSPSGADLAVTSVQEVPARATAGDRFSARVVVTNQGRARGLPTPLELLLSRDARPSSDDVVAGRTQVPALVGGARTTAPLPAAVPTGTSGRYRVIVCLAPKKPPRDKGERRNDCEVGSYLSVSRHEPPEQLPWVSAHLTGDIALRQSGHTEVGGNDHTWDRWGDVQVDVQVAAPNRDPASAEFTDAGSRYSWTGADTVKEGGDQCTFWTEQLEEGEGPLAGLATARYFPGTGQQTIELSLTLPYHLNGTSGADCNADHTWAEDHVNTTVLLLDLKATTEDDVSHYVASVKPPPGSIWNTVSAALDLEFERRPL